MDAPGGWGEAENENIAGQIECYWFCDRREIKKKTLLWFGAEQVNHRKAAFVYIFPENTVMPVQKTPTSTVGHCVLMPVLQNRQFINSQRHEGHRLPPPTLGVMVRCPPTSATRSGGRGSAPALTDGGGPPAAALRGGRIRRCRGRMALVGTGPARSRVRDTGRTFGQLEKRPGSSKEMA